MVLVPLHNNKYTIDTHFIIDIEDFDKVENIKWYLSKCGRKNQQIYYVIKTKDGKNKNRQTLHLHRIIFNLKPGDKITVDHIDGNRLNNCKSNLRLCSTKDNNRNKGFSINNTSGYKGVTWDKARNKWTVGIKYNYKRLNLGRFENILDAAKAYDLKAIELFGEFANTNFPKETYNATK